MKDFWREHKIGIYAFLAVVLEYLLDLVRTSS